MQASKELWEHVMLLVKTDKKSFEGGLFAWHNKWNSFLNERKTDASGKNRYVHKRLRSAYRSLKTNLPWLFTWYDNISLKIPHTTNAIDGHFADLNNKLRNHNGLSTARKMKFIDEFLMHKNFKKYQWAAKDNSLLIFSSVIKLSLMVALQQSLLPFDLIKQRLIRFFKPIIKQKNKHHHKCPLE